MKAKINSIPNTIITRDLAELSAKAGNIYEAVAVIAERSKQISNQIKEEISGRISEFVMLNDNLEEVFENREQIEVSRTFERMPKPTTIATEEFLKGQFTYTVLPEPDEE
jgi:DNA-directed RNA polymerase subunit K/omega